MVKHTQTIHRQQPMNCLSVFNHFENLALKGLNCRTWSIKDLQQGLTCKSCGISGSTFDLTLYFLSNRRLQVVLDKKSSPKYPANASGPQSSILVLILFLLYINDLPDDYICYYYLSWWQYFLLEVWYGIWFVATTRLPYGVA